jgi:hypothetical protein
MKARFPTGRLMLPKEIRPEGGERNPTGEDNATGAKTGAMARYVAAEGPREHPPAPSSRRNRDLRGVSASGGSSDRAAARWRAARARPMLGWVQRSEEVPGGSPRHDAAHLEGQALEVARGRIPGELPICDFRDPRAASIPSPSARRRARPEGSARDAPSLLSAVMVCRAGPWKRGGARAPICASIRSG